MKAAINTALTRNWTLKVFSLVVSILLFLFVSVESSTTVEVEYPMEYRTSPDIMLTADAPRRLTATLKGPGASFRTFNDLEPVMIDLTRAEPGRVRHRIDYAEVTPPAGMTIVSINPSEVEIELDRKVEKLVSVEVDPIGRPAFGYEIAELRADPGRVRVEGPMSRMRTFDFVHTRPIDLTDRTEDLTQTVELRPPVPPLRLVDRTSVTVFVDITEEVAQRDLEVPVVVEGAPGEARTNAESVLLTIKGPRRFVDRLAKDSLVAVVDVGAEVREGSDRLEKAVELRPPLPERTQIIGPAPRVVVTLGKRRRN